MKLVVVGNGWLGSPAAEEARRQGHEVQVLARSREPQLFRVRDGEAEPFERTLARLDPDAIINALGRMHGSDDELHTANAMWAKRIAEAAATGTSHLVHIGSAAEYGPGAGRLISEDDPTEPVSAYGRTKLEGSTAVGRLLGPRGTVARVFNVYGPGAPPRSPMAEFAREARRRTSEPFVVRNGGTVRDYLPRSFVGCALVELAVRRAGGAINVCSGHGVSFDEIIRAMLEHEQASHRPITSLDEPTVPSVLGDPTRLRTIVEPPAVDPAGIASALLD